MILIKTMDFLKLAALTSTESFLLAAQTTTNIQRYSMIPKSYMDPVFKREEQDALFETGDRKRITRKPIKPAFTCDTSSEFHDHLIGKFINYIMRNGNKVLARNLLEKAFENVKMKQLAHYNSASPSNRENIIIDPREIFHKAVQNCKPILTLQKMRKGGITYQVPVPVSENMAMFLSMNWLIRAAKDKDQKQSFSEILAKELIDAANNQGRVVLKKQELHRQCEANRAYAHFRWL